MPPVCLPLSVVAHPDCLSHCMYRFISASVVPVISRISSCHQGFNPLLLLLLFYPFWIISPFTAFFVFPFSFLLLAMCYSVAAVPKVLMFFNHFSINVSFQIITNIYVASYYLSLSLNPYIIVHTTLNKQWQFFHAPSWTIKNKIKFHSRSLFLTKRRVVFW